MRTGNLLQEVYKCEICGTQRTINRKAKKKIDHPKHMICTGCGGKKTKYRKVE